MLLVSCIEEDRIKVTNGKKEKEVLGTYGVLKITALIGVEREPCHSHSHDWDRVNETFGRVLHGE